MLKKIPVKDKKIIIVTHESIPVGPAHEFKNILLKDSVQKIIFITHPLFNMKEFYKKSSKYEIYNHGKKIAGKSALHWILPDPLLYLKDFIYTLKWCLSGKDTYDLYLGLDPLNALAGLTLKKLGRVKKVAYYTIDYTDKRFRNKTLNYIYHLIDKLSVKFADETWNVSETMVSAREKYNNMNRKIYNRQYTVPIGIYFNRPKVKEFNKIDKNKLMYTGSLRPIMGVDLIIKSMPIIVKRMPDIKLEIIGGGPEEQNLKDMTSKLKLERYVSFHGWVKDRNKLEQLLSDGAIGLAPFNPKIAHDEVKNADPAKVKDYMLLGMPVITTKEVSYYKEIEKYKCGIIINYNIDDFSNAVFSLLENKSLEENRKNARDFVKKFDYETMLYENLKRIFAYEN